MNKKQIQMESYTYFEDINIYCYHKDEPGWTTFTAVAPTDSNKDSWVVACPDCGQKYKVTVKVKPVNA